MTLFVIILLIGLVLVNCTTNRIPSTGRFADANGEVITATITNTNRASDKAAVMKAQKDGRKFRVKLKPTEAHLWIKGDSINITLSEDGKNYRVMFNDYFRENEARLRDVAVEKLGKMNRHLFAARFVKYEKGHFEAIKNSSMDSQRIFAFVSYMRMIDIYTPVAALLAVIVFVWKKTVNPGWESILVVVCLILLILWTLYTTTKMCKSIIKKAQEQD